MVSTCHLCGSAVAEDGDVGDDLDGGFVCADCGNVTCNRCKSIGVGLDSDHCIRCRG